MQKLLFLLIIVCWACNTSTKALRNLRNFEKEISWPGLKDSVGNSAYYFDIENRNNLSYFMSIKKDTSPIGLLSIDYRGSLTSITTYESSHSSIVFKQLTGYVKYICFSTYVTFDSSGRIGTYHLEGYVFRFDIKGRLAAIYLCQNDTVIKDIFVTEPKYQLSGKKFEMESRRLTARERRILRRKE